MTSSANRGRDNDSRIPPPQYLKLNRARPETASRSVAATPAASAFKGRFSLGTGLTETEQYSRHLVDVKGVIPYIVILSVNRASRTLLTVGVWELAINAHSRCSNVDLCG